MADQYLVGYTFSGWFLDEDFVNELTEYIVTANDITLYAKWEKHSYQISLDTQGGNLLEPVNVLYLDPIELPIPTRDNYIFAGWYWDYGYENEFDWQTMNADNINLVAKWTTPEYHVNYYLLGGTNHEDNPLIVDGSEEILLNDPVMEGFTFVGWYLNQHFSGDPVTSIEQGITTDIELHAKWQMNQYDLTYVMLENPIGDDYGILHPGELVEDVANSEGIYTLLLTSDHRIFEYERHTIGPSVTTQYPVDMTSYFDLLEGEYITNIYAGDSHGAVLTSHKRLFMWDSNEYGQMALPVGTYSYGSEIPVDITDQFSLFPTEEIDLVALGARHTIVTTTHGRIFTFGLNNNGQLGVENNNYFANREPIEITLAFNLDAVKFEHFKYIYANRNHSMVITSENRVFVFGENEYGALGTGVEATVYEAPYEITNRFAFSLNEDIEIAKIAGSSGILITSENRIFTWGYNASGQLGLSLNYQTFTPVPITEVIGAITLEEDEIIVDASTGYVTMVLTSKGKLFITGSRELLIGTNRPDNSRSTFAEHTSLINLEENELITRVYNSHNIAASIITSKGNILSWGQTHRLGMGDHPEWQINLPSPINLVHIVPFNVATYYYTEAIESYNYEISGYQFLGWYVDSLLEIPFDITNMPAEDLIVYGYYQEIPS
ncbi:MAG: InlB B-repeat-containing protein [Candidatus Izemoplasmatales bacterium]